MPRFRKGAYISTWNEVCLFWKEYLKENNTVTSVKDKKAIKVKYKSKYMSQKLST